MFSGDIERDRGMKWVNGLMQYFLSDALRDLVPFVQFKKREQHPWRSVTLSYAVACNFTIKVK